MILTLRPTTDDDLVGDPNQFRNASRWLQYDGLDRLTVADSAAQPPLEMRNSPWSFSWSEGRFGCDALDNVRTFKMGYLDFRYQYSGHRLSTIQQGTDRTPLLKTCAGNSRSTAPAAPNVQSPWPACPPSPVR